MKKNNEVVETTATELNVPALTSDSQNQLLVADSSRQTFSSWNPSTMEDRKAYYNAINMPGYKLAECVNMELSIQHIYAETCEYMDKNTGESTPGVRIVLIDKDGKSYNTSSIGVYNCLSKIFQVFGTPDVWIEPLAIRVKQIAPQPDKKVLLLEVV